MEKIIYNNVIDFVRDKLNVHQFGFLKHRSCLSQLLIFYSTIINSMDSKIPTDVVYLDLSKAFDSVSHNKLLYKLWMLGITGPLWQWFRSYLEYRYHFVEVENKQSSLLPVLSGVPQGSPLLFLIYINDLPDIIPSLKVFLFADDTKLLQTIHSEENSIQLQSDLNEVTNWCKKWNLSMNRSKCKVMRFYGPVLDETSRYHIEGTEIDFTDNYKDLGILVSNTLDWSKHYSTICSKAYGAINLLEGLLQPTILKQRRIFTLP